MKTEKQQKQAEQKPEKLALFVDEARAGALLDLCKDYCGVLNGVVLPLFEQHNITGIPEEQIKELARDRAKLTAYIVDVEAKREQAHYKSRYLRGYIEQEARKDVKAKIDAYINAQEVSLNKVFDIDPQCKPFIEYDAEAGQYVPDKAKIDEHCTKYVEGAELDVWRKLQQATALLNDVFKGKTPIVFQNIWSNKDGVLYLDPHIKTYLLV